MFRLWGIIETINFGSFMTWIKNEFYQNILWGFQASFIGFIAYYSRIDSGMFELVQTRNMYRVVYDPNNGFLKIRVFRMIFRIITRPIDQWQIELSSSIKSFHRL